jgi:hypothetical protein
MRMQTVTTPRRARARPGRPAPAPVRNTTALLYRNSAWALVAFALAVLVAFWPSYFSRLTAQPTFHFHAHGLAMSLWCVMLIAQAWLIRTGHRARHRSLGVWSYALVPVIVVTTVNFVHVRMGGPRPLGTLDLHSLALMLNAVAAFAAIYGLAMYNRRTPAVHARYMLCTIFPLFTPVTDRLIVRHVPAIVPIVPRIDGAPIVPVAGFALADLILIGLWAWDWRAGRRSTVFPIVLGILLLYHASVMTFHRLPAWRAFGEWFLGLPLS